MINDPRFNRLRLLLGDEMLSKIMSKRVILFGVGGVGSWCAESLVRSGICDITLVDADKVCTTNINRQLLATTSTIDGVKVEVMKRRLLDINPSACVTALEKRYNEESAPQFNLDEYDYVIDAIDSLADKALLILNACNSQTTLCASMGAALKVDSSRISTAEFWKVQGCPLAASLRRRFKKNKTIPSRKFQCVYSDEVFANRGEVIESDGSMIFGKVATNGTLCHTTAIFGLKLAELVIKDILKDE
ncbi:MAG: tRNA threonylcarbamoyladenosine dehydratase [Muribaculaceae bacterium]|nr:tRNA threonylcarbamoyladenosine dehydratase [Muribaculaceae bacterium]